MKIRGDRANAAEHVTDVAQAFERDRRSAQRHPPSDIEAKHPFTEKERARLWGERDDGAPRRQLTAQPSHFLGDGFARRLPDARPISDLVWLVRSIAACRVTVAHHRRSHVTTHSSGWPPGMRSINSIAARARPRDRGATSTCRRYMAG